MSERELIEAARRQAFDLGPGDAETAQAPKADTHPESVAAGPALPRQFGNYRILAKIGQGGMGTVYKALHEPLGRVVALKILPDERVQDPQAVARFQREMKAVGKLDHPHIVRATDAG